MTIEEISLICELTNYSSFLDASFYLPYSPSIITKYVNNVEEELGVQIFIRSNKSRPLQLTDDGKVLLESLRRIDDDYNYLKRQINVIKNKGDRTIRVGSQPRFGNIHEQRILTDFIFANPTAKIHITKAPADDLIRRLISGNLDAAFITFNASLDLNEYFYEHGDKVMATHIVSESDMYTGISDKYFWNRDEVALKELEEFTFAFPFPAENDLQSARAAQSWKDIAKEKGMKLRYINLQGYDDTIFEMARQKKIAVTTTHVPTAKYEGIKFVRISDWTGGTNLYYLRCPSNKATVLRQLEQCVSNYKENLSETD